MVSLRMWNKSLPNLNPDQSARLLLDWVAANSRAVFLRGTPGRTVRSVRHAGRQAQDRQRHDRTGTMGGTEIDTTTSGLPIRDATRSGASRPSLPFRTRSTRRLKPTAPRRHGNDRIARRTRRGTRGLLGLSRFLTVQSAQDAEGHALDFFQNEAVHKSDWPSAATISCSYFCRRRRTAGETYRMRMTYRGNVISDAGNGIYFVGDRGSWYPHIGGMGQFATFDTTFRWPRKLQLVATGEKIEEHEEGDQRVGHWRSDGRAPSPDSTSANTRSKTCRPRMASRSRWLPTPNWKTPS